MSATTPLIGYALGYCTRPILAMRESAKSARCYYCGTQLYDEYATHCNGGITFWTCLSCFDCMPPVTDLIEDQNFDLDSIGVEIVDYVKWTEAPYAGSYYELVTWRESDGRFRDLYRFSPAATTIDFFSPIVLSLIPDGCGWEIRRIDYDGRNQDVTTISRSTDKPFVTGVGEI